MTAVTTPRTTQLFSSLANGIVLSTALAAFLPAFGMAVTASLFWENPPAILWVWPIIAVVVGLIFGMVVYNMSYSSIDRVLGQYVESLERVAEGDLTHRLPIP